MFFSSVLLKLSHFLHKHVILKHKQQFVPSDHTSPSALECTSLENGIHLTETHLQQTLMEYIHSIKIHRFFFL
jgi:hypothetical protein